MLSLRYITFAHVTACWLVGLVLSRRHHIFVGNRYLPAAMHGIAFDEETLQINITRTMLADSSHSWIAFNVSSLTRDTE